MGIITVLVQGFFFYTSAFFADINHQTNSSFSVLAIIYCSLYKSEIMLDKVTKACYNFLALLAIFNREMLLLFLVKFLKGFYQSHS